MSQPAGYSPQRRQTKHHAQCFDADGPASAEQIKKMTSIDILRQHIKQGLFNSVCGWARIHPLHALQLYTPRFACNHSHVITSCSLLPILISDMQNNRASYIVYFFDSFVNRLSNISCIF